MAEREAKIGVLKSEKVKNWATCLSLVGALLISAWGAFFRGEPGAALAYKELAKSFNELRAEFAAQRAFVDGFLDGVKHIKDAVPAPVSCSSAHPVTNPALIKACDPGYSLVGNRCVPKKVSVPQAPAPPMPATLEALKKRGD